jgi:ABC-2 type transport system permease protein
MRSVLRAPATYVAAVIFLLLMGGLYLLILGEFSDRPMDGTPAQVFFQWFWLPVFFLVPMLTMRSIAEERRAGTLETLMTTPVTATQIVAAKFLATYLFYLLLWALTLFFPLATSWYLDAPLISERLLERSALAGGYLFVAVSGLLLISIGIFCSSLTRTQLVAGMLTFCCLFVVILGAGLLKLQSLEYPGWLEVPLAYVDIVKHHNDYVSGIIDTRPLFLYVSNALLLLGLSVLVVESKA